jgi:hypothetical protein
MPGTVRDLLDSAAAVPMRMGGIIAALAPARLWPALDEYVPVTGSAVTSSVLTLLAAAAIGIPGFIHFGTEQADINNTIFLQMAVRPEAVGVLDSTTMTGMNGLALFGFLFLTPAGWTTVYLGCSGLLRVLAAAFDEGIGDPILTVVDAVLMRAIRGRRARRTMRRRESLEGPEMPDRVVLAASVGLADAEIVIVSARRKSGWDRGTVVITGDKFYRVGTIVERTIGGRLRTLYPLTEHKDLEVVRRGVHYEMPAMTTAVRGSG